MRIPALKLHKGTGQGYARVKGRCRYFGKHGTPECTQRYRAFIAELLAVEPPSPAPASLATVAEACAAYEAHAEARYVHPSGEPTGQVDRVRRAIAVLVDLYGGVAVSKIGAGHLDACRVDMGRRGWRRSTATSAAACIIRCWAWLVSRGHAHPDSLARMRALEPLRQGQYGLAESPAVLDVPEADYRRVLARLQRTNPVVAAMVCVQYETGMRPGEACAMRWEDIAGWGGDFPVYTPATHKMSHKGQARRVVLFPGAVEAMRTLDNVDGGHVFRPADAWAFNHSITRTAHPPGWRKRAPGTPKRRPGEYYTITAYGTTLSRACEAEGVAVFYPYRLRHTAATRFKAMYGWATTAALLGHSSPKMSARYVHVDALAELLAEVRRRAA